ncbi:MAG: hypothetical protein K2H43_02510, partial [Clostridia bacterium]|nr:hypothetical protein [Clostridia bacterium]
LYTLDGEQVTVSATNIWDIEEIPEFTFEVKYTGAVIEEMKEQSNGYRDSSYTVSSFTVVALSGIEREYNLYRIDESKYESLPSYAQLVEQAKEYTKNSTEIEKADQWKLIAINEQDDELDEDEGDNVYQWNPSSSLSFVPKEAGFYIVQLIVTDPNRSSEQKFGYQVIQVQNPYDYTPGESQWLQNNLVSVVLFSISAILLVVIIVLFVSKPSEKKVEDIDLEKLKGKKKSKK